MVLIANNIDKKNNNKKQGKALKQQKLKDKVATIGFKENLDPKKVRKLKLSSQQWLTRQLNDIYVKAAKKDGYYSRSAYKLIEINDKFNILKAGLKVVDLGAAPGGWSQVVATNIFKNNNNNSQLISLDLLEISPIMQGISLQGDFNDENIVNQIKELLNPHKADVVLSDMAPNTVGIQSIDHLRIMGLVEQAYIFATEVLSLNGIFVAKVFQGGTTVDLLNKIKLSFKQVYHFKPDATRKESNEIYLIAKGYKG